MIEWYKNNREKKNFWTKDKETRVKIEPRINANVGLRTTGPHDYHDISWPRFLESPDKC